MAVEVRKAARKQAKMRLNISGPSGSGKTTGALLIAYGLVGDWSKVGFVDSENRSSDLYANFTVPGTGVTIGEFLKVDLSPPFTPERFIEANKALVDAGCEVIITDSISHEWEGKGGCLEIHERLGGQFKHWAEVTPRHRAFIDNILQSPVHQITCARTKTDYAMTVDNGKAKVEKVGLKDVTREGYDYEVSADLDIDILHNARASKDRTGLFMDRPAFMITVDTGKVLKTWCENGAPEAPKQTVPDATPAGKQTTAPAQTTASALDGTLEKIKTAKTMEELAEIGAGLAGSMPDADLKKARQAWLKRQGELKEASQ